VYHGSRIISISQVSRAEAFGQFSVNLPLHHKVQKFSSGTGSPDGPGKKGRKTVVMWLAIKNIIFWCWVYFP